MDIPPVIAHRGASAYAPENTLIAFQKARELGVSMIELDVKLSQDGEPVVLHDDDVKRTTDGKGECHSFPLSSLKQLDAGRWFGRKFKGERIPTLTESIALMGELGIGANIEIKPNKGQGRETAVTVLSRVNEYWPDTLPPPLFSSFDLDVLDCLRSLSPDINLGLLLYGWREDWRALAEKYQCVSVHINYQALTKKRIEEIKLSPFLLLVYVVNRPRRALKLLKMGVDAIFTDYPDLLL
jgi:glycerophosphoryl diester phosphodiesterase